LNKASISIIVVRNQESGWLLQVLAEPTVASRKPKLAISKFDQLVQTYLYKRDRADKQWKLNKRAAGTLMETPHRTRPSVGMGTMSILFTATIEIEDFCFLTAIIGSIAKSRITHLHLIAIWFGVTVVAFALITSEMRPGCAQTDSQEYL
jgi:hypothetical protein